MDIANLHFFFKTTCSYSDSIAKNRLADNPKHLFTHIISNNINQLKNTRLSKNISHFLLTIITSSLAICIVMSPISI